MNRHPVAGSMALLAATWCAYACSTSDVHPPIYGDCITRACGGAIATAQPAGTGIGTGGTTGGSSDASASTSEGGATDASADAPSVGVADGGTGADGG